MVPLRATKIRKWNNWWYRWGMYVDGHFRLSALQTKWTIQRIHMSIQFCIPLSGEENMNIKSAVTKHQHYVFNWSPVLAHITKVSNLRSPHTMGTFCKLQSNMKTHAHLKRDSLLPDQNSLYNPFFYYHFQIEFLKQGGSKEWITIWFQMFWLLSPVNIYWRSCCYFWLSGQALVTCSIS